MLGPCCCPLAFSSCGEWELLPCGAQAHCRGVSCGAQTLGRAGFSSCGPWAQLPWGTWDLPGPGIESVLCIGRGILHHLATREALYIYIYVCEVTQLWLCNSMDCSPPGSSVCGFLQARILEWVAMSSSRGSSQPRDWTQISRITGRRFTDLSHQGSPYVCVCVYVCVCIYFEWT